MPPQRSRQLGLFEAPVPQEDPKRKALNAALDRIAGRFGERAVVPADLAGKKRGE